MGVCMTGYTLKTPPATKNPRTLRATSSEWNCLNEHGPKAFRVRKGRGKGGGGTALYKATQSSAQQEQQQSRREIKKKNCNKKNLKRQSHIHSRSSFFHHPQYYIAVFYVSFLSGALFI